MSDLVARRWVNHREHLQMVESLLKYLAMEAVPEDQRHCWVQDIPWHRVIEIALNTLPRGVSLEELPMCTYLVRLNRLLGVNFLQ